MARNLPRSSLLRRFAALAASALLSAPMPAAASAPGGPLDVGSPKIGIYGTPMTWDPAAMPIHYRVDPGPLAKTPTGTVVIDNPTGVSRVQGMFSTWTSVQTALLSSQNDGPLLSTGAYTGGPVSNGSASVANFNALQA